MVLKQCAEATSPDGSGEDPILDRLKNCIEHASHLLPAQGPISVFIHHNTLHAFEHLPFEEATQRAARVFGCEPYLTEARYHTELAKGRIRADDLRAALSEDAPTSIAEGISRLDLHLAMLQLPPWQGTVAELRWQVAEDGIPRVHGDVWQRCVEVVRGQPCSGSEIPSSRPRDSILAVGGSDPDLLVNDLLTRYTAAFLDQGISRVVLPGQREGFFRGFCMLYANASALERWRRDLGTLCQQALAETSAILSVLHSLNEFGILETEWDEFLSETLLALRGWGGMIHQVEQRADSVHHPIPRGTLIEFLAVRLLLDRAALSTIARNEFGYIGAFVDLREWLERARPSTHSSDIELRTYEVFRAARALGIQPDAITHSFAREVAAFPSLQRRWIFQLAYERGLRIRALDALAHRVKHPADMPAAPRFQLVTCLDEREESFRRHVEEIAPDCETFGAAGFFAVPMYYRGSNDAHFVPLCPIVVTPKHWVSERVDDHAAEYHHRTSTRRAQLGRASHSLHHATRTPLIGALLAAGAGALASLPLVARILFPRITGRIRGTAGKVLKPTPHTSLALERTAEAPGDHNGLLGFNLDEMAAMGERLLRDIGLVEGFANLVFVLGHGSSSLNNPHKSSYDCGACGGSPGAPNGRAIAHLLNDGRVRAKLIGRGITIPMETRFVGGFHNTCDDSVALFDIEGVLPALRSELDRVRAEFDEAGDRNAHERARRFESCPLSSTPRDARKHVEARSEDLAQARPELGHATNAICIVGRRARSRGLFFDRRAFLTSYDPTRDTEDGAILARTLAAVLPVCGGINLEYFFSHVDPQGYGSGTKLPHNLTGLLGVMDGAASDLRTGLPWQMTEIHEPVRLLIVIETTLEIFQGVMRGNSMVESMVRKGWVQVALMHPDTGAISVFDGADFVAYARSTMPLRCFRSSVECYGGKRDHLDFVEISSIGATC